MTEKAVVVGVAGASGSGKSTFAKSLVELLPGSVCLSVDDFFFSPLPNMISPQDGREYPDWNHPSSIDVKALKARLSELALTAPYLVVEGALLLCLPEIPPLLDYKIYIDATIETRFYRRISRNLKKGQDLEFIAGYYLNCARHREKQYALTTKALADLVIDNEVSFAGHEKLAAQRVLGMAGEELQKR